MGRIEILTGVERRRGWSDDQKQAILDEISTSGLGVSAIARRHDVLPQQIYAWRCALRQKVEARRVGASFLPVTIVPAPLEVPAQPDRSAGREKAGGPARGGKIEIRCKGGRLLKLDSSLDPAALRVLIRAVEEA